MMDNKVAAVADIAIQFDLTTRTRQWAALSAKDKDSLQKELVEFLSRVELSREHVTLVMDSGQMIERSGDPAAAAALYTKLMPVFRKSKDQGVATFADRIEGVARRLNLLGNSMEIDGSLLDGSTFDWASYQGKVVLVDFWATWCGPCVRELPNVLTNYERYHDKGFDVVGISLDRDSATVKKFVADREIPWVTLYHEGGSGSNPTADYYGILSIPTVILVDQQGKVVSLHARGPELGKQLEKLLGKAEAAEDSAKSEKAKGVTKS
jgi:thiol-disulfide isomerase/thioredoxin